MDELRFRIDAFRPETIPLARLAEYMASLAALLGNEAGVHFVRLDPGSVEAVVRVETECQPKVSARLTGLRQGDAPAEVVRAFKRLDDMLAEDNAVGRLATGSSAVVVEFPGRTRPQPLEFGPITQQRSLDGTVERIGGAGDTVPVHIRETGPVGALHICEAKRIIAGQLGNYMFNWIIRVHGTGRWIREASGKWKMLKFFITGFEELNNDPLEVVVARLRAIPGSKWGQFETPFGILRDLRGGGDEI